MECNPTEPRHGRGTAIVGTVVAIYTFFDAALIGLPIIVLVAWLNPLIVAAVALVVVTVLNLGVCNRVERQSETWIAGSRFVERLDHA